MTNVWIRALIYISALVWICLIYILQLLKIRGSCRSVVIIMKKFKVTGHPLWRFVENRYCALKISPIFIKFSPNVSQCMQNMIKL
jgi:hypothetical protein